MSETGNRFIELDLGDGLRVRASDDPASPALTSFYEGYCGAFVLPDEMEDLAGFRECLALNASHRHAYGRTHSELAAIFENASGQRLGGANFLATAIDCGTALPPASVALNYVYVEEAARGQGLLRRIVATVERLVPLAIGTDRHGLAPAIFIEQNDPLRAPIRSSGSRSGRGSARKLSTGPMSSRRYPRGRSPTTACFMRRSTTRATLWMPGSFMPIWKAFSAFRS
jgi:GNAT superfamily N-acetyltransferase